MSKVDWTKPIRPVGDQRWTKAVVLDPSYQDTSISTNVIVKVTDNIGLESLLIFDRNGNPIALYLSGRVVLMENIPERREVFWNVYEDLLSGEFDSAEKALAVRSKERFVATIGATYEGDTIISRRILP